MSRQGAVPIENAGTTGEANGVTLRDALDNEQLWVAYQPKVECATRTVKAFELLARWEHPVSGDIPPRVFIPLAESSGLICELTLRVLESGLKWINTLPHHSELILCVNLSSKLFESPGFLVEVSRLCDKFDTPTSNIIFELSEAGAPLDSSQALAFVTRLRINGFSAAIDDVGSGHGSLVRLSNLPYSEMKIDRSVLVSASSATKQKLVLEYLVNVGHSIGLVVVAEGVEDKESLDLVESVGCDLVQGNYIGTPMHGADARNWYLHSGHRP